MAVDVEFLGSLGIALKQHRERVLCPPKTTVRTLIDELSRKHRDSFKEMVLDATGNRHESLLITVNGTCVWELQELDTELRDNDRVAFMYPMSGG